MLNPRVTNRRPVMKSVGVKEVDAPLTMNASSMLEMLHAITRKVLNSIRFAMTSFWE